MKYFKNSQKGLRNGSWEFLRRQGEKLSKFFSHISQVLNLSTFGDTADIYAIAHLVSHACQHITADSRTCYYCLLAANQGNDVREIFLKKLGNFSLYQRKNYHDPLLILFVADF
jgi:hypothetical protein